MRMYVTETGEHIIDQDEELLARIEGENLDGIDVSDLRIDSENVAQLYEIASIRKSLESIGRYTVLKQLYLDKFDIKPVEDETQEPVDEPTGEPIPEELNAN